MAIIEDMADIYGYAHAIKTTDGSKVVLTLRTAEDIACGGRFKYIDNEIDFTYDALAKALQDAIDKEAKMTDYKFVTEARETAVERQTYDFDALKAAFESMVSELMQKDKAFYAPRITQIVERYMGKGKKVSEATFEQAELLHLIVSDMKDELIEK